jgi:insertion element IS1 protein InsB
VNNLSCPCCGLSHIKRNGHTHYRKQNYQCLSCRRQFVKDAHRIDAATRALVKKLLLERVSLRGICRVLSVSLVWLLNFIAEVYDQLPDDLYVLPVVTSHRPLQLLCLEAEADEMWSFVKRSANKQWVWLAFDPQTRQVLAFYVGDRSRQSACQLWRRVPRTYQEQATFSTDY